MHPPEPESEPALTWAYLERLRARISAPIVLKGILHPDDARKAIDAGAAAIVVSNHGGRTLDGAIPTAEILPEVAEAVDGRVEIIVDGGIRRGGDVIRALALGARAVLVGRPFLWGLAINGEAGQDNVFRPCSGTSWRRTPGSAGSRRHGGAARSRPAQQDRARLSRAHHRDPSRHADPRSDHRPRLHRRGPGRAVRARLAGPGDLRAATSTGSSGRSSSVRIRSGRGATGSD